MIINNDKLNIQKPKSMILNEIDQLKEERKSAGTICEKLKISAKIADLSLQLQNQ